MSDLKFLLLLPTTPGMSFLFSTVKNLSGCATSDLDEFKLNKHFFLPASHVQVDEAVVCIEFRPRFKPMSFQISPHLLGYKVVG